jgi:preprotein translocase subunit SecA
MAGRGTDILLGGNAEYLTIDLLRKQNKSRETIPPEEWEAAFKGVKEQTDREHDEVTALGGLHILATERHESRRIDNQLRGRAGRQGDPGSSRFYLSLQDDLMRIFGGERMQNLMLRLGMEEDVPIESRLITKRIAAAQKAVEAQNFAARKHILEYDDVMNKQRQAVYGMRRALLEGQDQKERMLEIIRGILQSAIDVRCPENVHATSWDYTALQSDLLSQFGVKINPQELTQLSRAEIEETLYEKLARRYDEKEQMVGPAIMRDAERMIMLNVIDNQWKDHLLSMDHLKEGIGLRGYGQKDPLIEYKKESFTMFQDMMDRIEDETIRYLYFLQVAGPDEMAGDGQSGRPILPFPSDEDEVEEEEDEAEMVAVAPDIRPDLRQAAQNSMQDFTRNIQRKKEKEMADLQFVGSGTNSGDKKQAISDKKAGRNDPCPCGSGKKYKKCHGA